jgi:hypothetical protein
MRSIPDAIHTLITHRDGQVVWSMGLDGDGKLLTVVGGSRGSMRRSAAPNQFILI